MAGKKSPAGLVWDEVPLAPLILLTDPEQVIGDWAEERLIGLARERDSHTEITKIDARTYARGTLSTLAGPSLFGEPRMLVVRHVEAMSEFFQADVLAYLNHPEEDVVLLMRRGGKMNAKKIAEAVSSAGFPHATFDLVKRPADKIAILRQLAARHKRKVTHTALEALVDAFQKDFRELSGAFLQLLEDVEGVIDEQAVRAMYAGRHEAQAFDVADAALAGATGRAIALARYAVGVGTTPVAIVGAIALKLRQMCLVVGARRHGAEGSLGLASWQTDRIRRELRAWSGEGLAQAVLAVASGDEEVKGGSRDAHFALERLIVRLGDARKIH